MARPCDSRDCPACVSHAETIRVLRKVVRDLDASDLRREPVVAEVIHAAIGEIGRLHNGE